MAAEKNSSVYGTQNKTRFITEKYVRKRIAVCDTSTTPLL